MIQDYSIFIVALVAFTGVFIGELLAFISPEELKPGRKYFVFFEMFFLVIICFLGLALSRINLFAVLVGLFLGFFYRRVYAYFAGLVFIPNFIFAVLVFIYGLFYGTLERPLKSWRFLILDFVLFSLIGFLSWYFILDFSSLMLGGLITIIYFKAGDYKKCKDKRRTRKKINAALNRNWFGR